MSGKTLSHPQGGNLFDVQNLFTNYKQNNNNMLVYNKDYVGRYMRNAALKDLYEFSNNINVFYKNYIQPVFTVSFDVLMEKKENSNIVIARMYMDNQFGTYSKNPCNNVNDELGTVKNNNMFMIIAEYGANDKNGFNLSVVLGRGDNCNYNTPFTDKSNVKVAIPYMPGNSKARIIVTVSPNEKIIAAFWMDAAVNYPRVAISRSTYCGNDLNLHRLFKEKPRKAPIENIIMNINRSIVGNVNYVMLGYKNLASEYQKYI